MFSIIYLSYNLYVELDLISKVRFSMSLHGYRQDLSMMGNNYFQHPACLLSCFSPVQLFVTLWTVGHQAPLSLGILQARILEWVDMPYSRGSFQPKDGTQSLSSNPYCRQILYHQCHVGSALLLINGDSSSVFHPVDNLFS